jgi:hypothetical protein
MQSITGLNTLSTIFVYPQPDLDNYKVEYLDNGDFVSFAGSRTIGYPYTPVSLRKITASYTFKTRTDFQTLNSFYKFTNGQLSRFWLACWSQEFSLAVNANLNDPYLMVNFSQLTAKNDPNLRIFITTKAGDLIVRKITSYEVETTGYERLMLDTAMPMALNITDISFFGRLILARHASDFIVKIQKADGEDMIGQVNLVYQEVPYEYSEV